METGNMKKQRITTVLLLNALLMAYSFTGILSKLAAGVGFMSFRFCLYYGAEIILLGIYAIGWQQIIKRMSLTAAFANKAVTVVWGLIWGAVFFKEAITAGKIVGAILVIAGVVTYVLADKETENG